EGALLHRVLRVSKNRFGPAQELCLFEMRTEGLCEVAEPSALFLAERAQHCAGSVVVASAESSRPLLVEVQALVASAPYGSARRVASGLDVGRLAILIAVLEKRVGLVLADQDVFTSVTGGLRLDERGVDLALAMALVSSFRNAPFPEDCTVFGEVGLTGEVRPVPRMGQRLREAARLGFRRALVPEGGWEPADASSLPAAIERLPIRRLEQALDLAFVR
ncbi:MAG: magnesium chelatase domain-containing protein, partial [Polyangiales bacterium]